MKDDNKVHAKDTLRDLKDNPKEALHNDYEQTKADMQSIKEKATGERYEDEPFMDMRL
ncbi:MAG: hypothetical protein V4519_00860 [Patescibacteria group bacterium]